MVGVSDNKENIVDLTEWYINDERKGVAFREHGWAREECVTTASHTGTIQTGKPKCMTDARIAWILLGPFEGGVGESCDD